MVYIYSLKHPEQEIVYYIGATINPLIRRRVYELVLRGYFAVMKILDITSFSQVKTVEDQYVQMFELNQMKSTYRWSFQTVSNLYYNIGDIIELPPTSRKRVLERINRLKHYSH